MPSPIRLITLIIVLALSTLSSPAPAQELVVGVENIYYRPFYYVEKGRYSGVARDLLDAFAARNQLTLKYKPLPVNRLYKEFLDGNLDLKFPDNPNWKPEMKKGHQIYYSQPAVPFIDGVMVKPAHKGRGLAGLKVLGTVLGFTPWSYQGLIAGGKLKLVENASFSGLLEQTLLGRIDGAYMNPVVARYQLREVLRKPGALVYDPELPHIEDAYRLSSGRHPELIQRFDRFLKEHADLVHGIKTKHKVDF